MEFGWGLHWFTKITFQMFHMRAGGQTSMLDYHLSLLCYNTTLQKLYKKYKMYTAICQKKYFVTE